MSITQNPATVVKAGIPATLAVANVAVVSWTTEALGEVRHVFNGGALLTTLTYNAGTKYQVSGIVLNAHAVTPPAKGSVITVDTVVYLVEDANIEFADSEEAKINITMVKYSATYA